jgi:hypothetical protein
MALYIYGYVRSADAREQDGGVTVLREGEVSALVNELGEEVVAPRRANLLAHAAVLERALEHGPVLPLKFGMVSEEEVVREDLRRRATELAEQLAAFENRIEMGVSALYREEEVLREVIAENPAVAEARRALEGRPEAATHFQRIHLGELVANAIEAKRAEDGHDILRELGPHAVACSTDPPMHERMVVNAAFLVERDKVAAFDAAVEQVSRLRAQRMQFKLLGPRPPHSFVGAA